MNCQKQIDSYIEQNNWTSLESYLGSQKGFIEQNFGGRCCSGPYLEFDGYADINKVCRDVLGAISKVSTNRSFKPSLDERIELKKVIAQLERLYNDTEKALAKAPCFAFLATRFYDFLDWKNDGYRPVDRLGDNIPSVYKIT